VSITKKILSFRVLDSPHTANIIFKFIIEVLQEYNLKSDMDNKVFSISFEERNLRVCLKDWIDAEERNQY
jgi:hypothetical protein